MPRKSEEKSGESRVLERGNIYFIYRPKVQEEDAEGIEEVERFYVVLKPEGAEKFRRIVVGRKRLPEVGDHERNWAFVDMIARSAKDIEEALREETYETKTRGERVLPAARPAGEGVYAIAKEGRNMHLVYALELPKDPGPVQKELNIAPEASFVMSVKNPEKGSPPNVGLRKTAKADYPTSLQRVFRDRRFASEDPRLLDYEGAELMLVGARADPEKAHDVELEPQDEKAKTADIIKELRFAESRHPIEPLLKGEWR